MNELKNIYNRIVIFLIVFLGLIIFTFFFNKFYDDNSVLTNYLVKGNIDYKVYLKDNKGVSNQDLFVSQATDNILVNFNYKCLLDKNLKLKYKYDIISYVIADIDDSSLDIKEVYRDNETIFESEYIDIVTNSLNIDKKISLDYSHYNDIALEYDNSVNIPIKSRLMVEFNLYIEYETGEIKNYKESLTLPLEKSTFSITKNESNEKGVINVKEKSNKKLVIVVLLVIFDAIFLILIIYSLLDFIKYRKKHILEFKYKKIMKDYDNIVVPINKIPKDSSIVSIKVLYFKSMIDIQKELHLPILCYRSEEFIVYMIINNKLAYIYFLNDVNEKI